MEFLVIIAGIVLLLMLYPYIRLFVKRMIMGRKIKNYCKRNNLNFFKTHWGWRFGTRKSTHCDFYIETSSIVYSVKLFSSKKKRAELHFTQSGTYYFRSFIAFASIALIRMPIDSKPKKFPSYDFHYAMKDSFYTKKIKPILLINPVCQEIKYLQGNHETVVSSGEMINDTYIFSLSQFFRELGSTT